MVSRMGLSGAQECGGIKMAGVMVLLVHNKVPLRVEYSGLVQVIVETRPDESCEPCGDQRVGCGRAGFGLHGARRSRKAVRVEGGVEQKMVVEKQGRLSQKVALTAMGRVAGCLRLGHSAEHCHFPRSAPPSNQLRAHVT